MIKFSVNREFKVAAPRVKGKAITIWTTENDRSEAHVYQVQACGKETKFLGTARGYGQLEQLEERANNEVE